MRYVCLVHVDERALDARAPAEPDALHAEEVARDRGLPTVRPARRLTVGGEVVW